MYKHIETDDRFFSIHDCYAEKVYFNDGVLSFVFPNGFWVTNEHLLNRSENIVRTDEASVDFTIMDEEFDGISIHIFKKQNERTAIREEWGTENFINAVNHGEFKVEFIDCYKTNQYLLFKCQVRFDRKPYYEECEIILHTDKAVYNWNSLRYDCTW